MTTLLTRTIDALSAHLGAPTHYTVEPDWTLASWNLARNDEEERSAIVWGDAHRVEVTVDLNGANKAWTVRGIAYPEAPRAPMATAIRRVAAWARRGR